MFLDRCRRDCIDDCLSSSLPMPVPRPHELSRKVVSSRSRQGTPGAHGHCMAHRNRQSRCISWQASCGLGRQRHRWRVDKGGTADEGDHETIESNDIPLSVDAYCDVVSKEPRLDGRSRLWPTSSQPKKLVHLPCRFCSYHLSLLTEVSRRELFPERHLGRLVVWRNARAQVVLLG